MLPDTSYPEADELEEIARLGVIELSDAEPYVSFDDFVRTEGPSLVRTAFLLVGDAGAAEDVVQIALAKLAPRWARIVAGGPARPYVRVAVVRTAISWRRRHWHGEVATGAVPEADNVEAERALDRFDQRERLRIALGRVPARQRACIVLRHYEDLDEATTAAILGCSVGTVKSQTARGLASLRAALAGDR